MRLSRDLCMPAALPQRRSLIEEFSARGLRLTEQRSVLLEIIQSATGHLDAATLLRLAREQDATINRATVYRTLELLKNLRLVDELDLMHLNGEKHYYEMRTGEGHIHLACFRCGKIEEFSSPLFERLKQEIVTKQGFSVAVVRMEAGGRCRECAESAQ
jgi:Fur family transcriptional regulator, ferric uptake regulator